MPQHPPNPGQRPPQPPRSTANTLSSRKSRTRARVSQPAALVDASAPSHDFRILTTQLHTIWLCRCRYARSWAAEWRSVTSPGTLTSRRPRSTAGQRPAPPLGSAMGRRSRLLSDGRTARRGPVGTRCRPETVPSAHGSSTLERWFDEHQPRGGLAEPVHNLARDSPETRPAAVPPSWTCISMALTRPDCSPSSACSRLPPPAPPKLRSPHCPRPTSTSARGRTSSGGTASQREPSEPPPIPSARGTRATLSSSAA